MNSFLINILIATIWLLLSKKPEPIDFLIGFTVGFLLLALFHPVMGSHPYVRRCVAVLRFLLVFLREFIHANFKVAWIVLFKSPHSFSPNFLTYNVSDLTRAEILLLSYCISLTPGSVTVKVAEDFNTLILHSLEADDPDAVREEIDQKLKKAIVAFTRSCSS